MWYKKVRFSFAGSFQCRLATNPGPTNARRNPPPPGQNGGGWTFDYNEDPFDRLIRCQNPIQLRTALVDPFTPVKVTKIEVQAATVGPVELPFQALPTDPLLGLPVSLGDHAMFDSDAGGGPGKEAILNCVVSFGTQARARPATLPLLTGVMSDPATVSDYLARKPMAIASAMAYGNITPPRVTILTKPPLALLSPPEYIEKYANFYGMAEDIAPVKAAIELSPAGAEGVLASLLLGWTYTLELNFSRFDGDTLTGKLAGTLTGEHSEIEIG